MADRVCIRGCTQRGVHYASCAWNGIEDGVAPSVASLPNVPPRCWGCAPRECRDGSLICGRCFGRMRALLADGPDLLGRVRSLADPMKATPTDKAPGGRSSTVEAPAPVDADLLDAITALEQLDGWWHVTLSDYSNDLAVITWLGEVVLDVHPELAGERSAWSVADAMAKWGVERRTKGEPAWTDAEDSEKVLGGIPEWGDQLLNRAESEKVAGTPRTLQRWLKDDRISPAATIYIAGVKTVLFRRSDLLKVKEQMRDRIGRPRTKTTEHEIGGQP